MSKNEQKLYGQIEELIDKQIDDQARDSHNSNKLNTQKKMMKAHSKPVC